MPWQLAQHSYDGARCPFAATRRFEFALIQFIRNRLGIGKTIFLKIDEFGFFQLPRDVGCKFLPFFRLLKLNTFCLLPSFGLAFLGCVLDRSFWSA